MPRSLPRVTIEPVTKEVGGAGLASGAAFGPGTTWIKELSEDGAGARRAAGALSAGFGGGPLVAGAMAQWLPAPAVVPYVAHLVVVAVAALVFVLAAGVVTLLVAATASSNRRIGYYE